MKNFGFSFDTTYTTLPKQFFSESEISKVPDPKTVIFNKELADNMGLDFSGCSDLDKANLFSGNQLPLGATPFSQAYAGHQFGYFTMLGHGRAHLWGEHIIPS